MGIKKDWYLYGIIVILFILCGVFYINMNQNDKTLVLSTDLIPQQHEILDDENSGTSRGLDIEDKKEEILIEEYQVHVSGAVKNPDVYTLPAGSIVKDAIILAGGSTVDADLDLINLAAEVQDNEKIYIPKIGETVDTIKNYEENSNSEFTTQDLININTAKISELESLPGIGEVKAKAIIAYREEQGGFSSIEDIQNVSGIGSKTFEKIKNLITIK